MHCAEAFLLLKRQGCDIFEGMDVKERREIRENIVAMILATDMKRHFSLVADLKSRQDQLGQLEKTKAVGSREDRLLILKAFIHGADIGNPIKGVVEFEKWTELLFDEFFKQGDKEKMENLEVSFLCDRDDTNIPKAQIGFCKFIVQPLYVQMLEISSVLAKSLKNIDKNIQVWEKKQDTKQNKI